MNQTMATTIGSSNSSDNGGRIVAIDLGEAVVLLPPGERTKLLADALSADDHLRFVRALGDPGLATS
jgi:hypothetical protein